MLAVNSVSDLKKKKKIYSLLNAGIDPNHYAFHPSTQHNMVVRLKACEEKGGTELSAVPSIDNLGLL